ncbi:MAG TPA: hypothetical protein VJL08_02605 [Dehalococcoidia bacterium]|nr:hypothetical protein [Dehalococcoidia bacterium]
MRQSHAARHTPAVLEIQAVIGVPSRVNRTSAVTAIGPPPIVLARTSMEFSPPTRKKYVLRRYD